MEIIRSIVHFIVRMVIINVVLILFFASAPLLYTVAPFWYLLHPSPYWNVGDMATVYMLTGPFACAFWMTVLCHWHTVRKAQREGHIENWRDSEGGLGRTVGKSFGFWFLGFFGSALAELVFAIVARPLIDTFTGHLEFFAMAPFATFAPVILLLLRRCMRRRTSERSILRAGSLHTKNI